MRESGPVRGPAITRRSSPSERRLAPMALSPRHAWKTSAAITCARESLRRSFSSRTCGTPELSTQGAQLHTCGTAELSVQGAQLLIQKVHSIRRATDQPEPRSEASSPRHDLCGHRRNNKPCSEQEANTRATPWTRAPLWVRFEIATHSALLRRRARRVAQKTKRYTAHTRAASRGRIPGRRPESTYPQDQNRSTALLPRRD